MIFWIIIILPLLSVWGCYICFGVVHFRLMQYFWRSMPDEDTAVINDRRRFPVFDMGKRRRAEMRKRNEVLLKFDRERAERLIAAEHKMCIAYQWWCLLVPMEFIIIVCRLAWDTH